MFGKRTQTQQPIKTTSQKKTTRKVLNRKEFDILFSDWTLEKVEGTRQQYPIEDWRAHRSYFYRAYYINADPKVPSLVVEAPTLLDTGKGIVDSLQSK